jgi:hypothetical protein
MKKDQNKIDSTDDIVLELTDHELKDKVIDFVKKINDKNASVSDLQLLEVQMTQAIGYWGTLAKNDNAKFLAHPDLQKKLIEKHSDYAQQLREFLPVVQTRIKYLQTKGKTEDTEPINVNGLLYPTKTAHKMLILNRLGILDKIKEQYRNSDNGNLARLVAVILNEQTKESIETIRKGLSNIKDLKNPTSEKRVESILNQFAEKKKRNKS